MKKTNQSVSRLRRFLLMPFVFDIVIIITNLAVLLIDRRAGGVMGIGSCICVGISAVFYFYKEPLLLKDLIDFSMEHAQVQNQLLRELPVSYAIMDDTGKILWSNDSFQEMAGKERGKNIKNLFPEVRRKDLPKNDERKIINVQHGEKFLRLELVNVTLPDEFTESEILENGMHTKLLALYVFDETESVALKQTIEDQKMVAGLIYLDNYDEGMAAIDEVRATVITALVDRKISRYFSQMGAVIKKLEKDK